MLSAVCKRVTYANVVMTLALVFAMAGGAYAAKKYLITSTKQISPKVLKQLEGKPGPAGSVGAQGPVGPAGANGKDGLPGAAGKEGPQGKEGKQGPQGVQGIEGKEGKEGKEGSPWTASGTLPSGKTETGAWAVGQTEGESFPWLSISYGLPLAEPATVKYVAKETSGGTNCPGSASEPAAAAGFLCVYAEGEFKEFPPEEVLKSYVSGAALRFEDVLPLGYAYGTWAVTAK